MKKYSTSLVFAIILFLGLSSASAQEKPEQEVVTNESSSSLDLNVDIVSRYLWRGLLYSPSPNIQPTLTFSAGGFAIGAWGSYSLSEQYAEVDLFVSYTTSPITLMVYDYYAEDETDLSAVDYFKWKKGTTGHQLEGTIMFGGTDKIPFTLTAATFFYGNDKNVDGDNNYSTYFEIAYPVKIAGQEVNLFLGGTPAEGLYHTEAGIVNVGFSTSKSLKITDSFELPVKGTFAVNPAAKDVFFVIGLTF
ncbi:MAG: hypothetical protein JW783_16740 [Bacteroidales bacterium]|nr:hypothetical protein [Bacteroidales bacterium]MBN2749576.1 hypothetical protein [Bacteroidales bacterium]